MLDIYCNTQDKVCQHILMHSLVQLCGCFVDIETALEHRMVLSSECVFLKVTVKRVKMKNLIIFNKDLNEIVLQ